MPGPSFHVFWSGTSKTADEEACKVGLQVHLACLQWSPFSQGSCSWVERGGFTSAPIVLEHQEEGRLYLGIAEGFEDFVSLVSRIQEGWGGKEGNAQGS